MLGSGDELVSSKKFAVPSICLSSCVAVFLLVAGCSGSGAAAGTCAPGSLATCPCLDGTSSTQRCADDGKSFSGCSCDAHGGAASSFASGTGGGGGMVTGVSGNAGLGGSPAPSIDSGGGDAGSQIPVGDVIAEPKDEAAYIFDQSALRTYNIVIAPADLATIDQNPAAEMYVPAMLELDGITYGPYSVRYKGSYGGFLSPCTQSGPGTRKQDRCSMKLSFNESDPNGNFYGLRKLNFHAMIHDRSMMRDRLGYSLFRDMALAAPRAVHARVLINGTLEGLFAVVEQVDGRFTRSRFGEGGEGNLYKEIWPIHSDASLYIKALETNEDQAPSVQGMLDFKTAIGTSAAATEQMLDRAYAMRYAAVDRVIINDDGIFHWWCVAPGQGNNPGGFGNHNYYWYQEQAAPRFWLIPWDFDNAFNTADAVTVMPKWSATATCTCSGFGTGFGSQRPASCDPLTARFMEWNTDYEAEIASFIAGPFAPAAVEAKLSAWTTQIQAAVTEAAGQNGAPDASSWQTSLTSLRGMIDGARTNHGYKY